MTFQISPLPADKFKHLSQLSDEELAASGIVRKQAMAKPGFPCRVSLEDAEIGETVYLLNYTHHDTDTPYRSDYAIYVRDKAVQAELEPGEVPQVMHGRPLAFRGFSPEGHLLTAALNIDAKAEDIIAQQLSDPAVGYVHIHNAMHGCFVARADRA